MNGGAREKRRERKKKGAKEKRKGARKERTSEGEEKKIGILKSARELYASVT
jgi:hypothetical protein